jgi:hypothetical protein
MESRALGPGLAERRGPSKHQATPAEHPGRLPRRAEGGHGAGDRFDRRADAGLAIPMATKCRQVQPARRVQRYPAALGDEVRADARSGAPWALGLVLSGRNAKSPR